MPREKKKTTKDKQDPMAKFLKIVTDAADGDKLSFNAGQLKKLVGIRSKDEPIDLFADDRPPFSRNDDSDNDDDSDDSRDPFSFI